MSHEQVSGQIIGTPRSRSASDAFTKLLDLRQWLREADLRLPAIVFIAHWLIVTTMAALAMRFAVALPEVPTAGYRLPPLRGWQQFVIQPLRNWDGFWYGLIAEQGYGYHRATTAFWPLYPWSMSLVSQTLAMPVETAGLLLSNIAFFCALVVMRDLIRLEVGEKVANRALWFIALFPTAFYFSTVYTESYFLLFSVLTFWWGRAGRWGSAGMAGFLAALTRNVGGLLVVPLIIFVIKRHGRDPRQWPRTSLALTLPLAGSLVYLAFLGLVWGNPFLTFDIQENWGRAPATPWHTFAMIWRQVRFDWLWAMIESPTWKTLTSFEVRWSFAEYETLDLAITLLTVPLLIHCYRKLPITWGVWCSIVVVIPLLAPADSHPLMSMPRYILVLFPLFTAAAMLVRSRIVFIVALLFCTLLLCGLTVQFSTWFWVA